MHLYDCVWLCVHRKLLDLRLYHSGVDTLVVSCTSSVFLFFFFFNRIILLPWIQSTIRFGPTISPQNKILNDWLQKIWQRGINWNMPWIGGWIFKGLEKMKILNLTRCSLFCHFTKRESFSSSDQAVKWMKSVPTVHSHPPTVVPPPTPPHLRTIPTINGKKLNPDKGLSETFWAWIFNQHPYCAAPEWNKEPPKERFEDGISGRTWDSHAWWALLIEQHPPPTKKRTTSQKKKNRKWERPSNKRRWLNPFLGSDAVWANRRGVPLGTRRGIFEQNM